MSRLSAVWTAATLAIVFVLILGAVVLRPALSAPAQASETVQVDGTGTELSGDDGVELFWDDDDHDDDDEDDSDDSHSDDEDGENDDD